MVVGPVAGIANQRLAYLPPELVGRLAGQSELTLASAIGERARTTSGMKANGWPNKAALQRHTNGDANPIN